MKSHNVKKNHISSAVGEIFLYKCVVTTYLSKADGLTKETLLDVTEATDLKINLD